MTMVTDTGLHAGIVPPENAGAVLANARAVEKLVRAEADAIEARGHLTDAAARVFRDAGLFQMAFPASRGGLEMPLSDQVAVVAAVSRFDASAGWNVGVLNAGGYYAGRLGEAAYAELYPSPDAPTSGSFHPRGHAERVEGGYLVTGQWDWGSGSYTADYIVGGCLVFENGAPLLQPDGRQVHLGLWLPKESIVVAHNWQTLGLRGSGSTSYSITEPVFVPEHHSFDREAEPNPDADPLNKGVEIAHFALTGVCLGLAQHAVDLASEAVSRRTAGSSSAAVDAATLQALGDAINDVDYTYSGVLEVARRTDEIIFTPGRVLDPAQSARMTAANAVAASMLRRVLPICTELAGARGIFDSHPMQRVVRDATSALAHMGTRRVLVGNQAAALLDRPASGPLAIDDTHGHEGRP